ncbi:efflux RND transporter permease subunit [Chitinimonas sp. BJB300]|uniref:efflux RND transporter permease subunit n=1 Tax=Chitinimonas sp. BJB300 TaxID=1559339 RepID=UPI000C0F071B|nr:efflux RND transporter permease subunit [Chitinimonas sp. BJB300]PHV09945.1 multidrug transporter AcrB [Chitinimonas sp. BJB300]TSJ90888.1 efflux RND transporter permease subunit [Chitinimonas sp. BJB300]
MRGINLSEWALKHQQLVLYFIIVFMLAGAFSYTRLGQKEDPEFTFKAMIIQAYWPGASATDMELQVTDKLEKKLQEMSEIEYVRSYSKAGENQLLINLKEGVPPSRVQEVWYQVRKKIGDVKYTLPSSVQGPFFNDEFGDTFGNLYAFTSDGFSYADLKKYVDAVRTELLRVPDVNKIDYVGVQEEKIYVETSSAKLASLGLDPALILQTLQATNAVVPGGVVQTSSERVTLRVTGEFNTIESIRNIGIQANGRHFRLGDVAKVYRGYTDPTTAKMRFNGQEAIGLAVSMRKGGDVIQLGEQLDASLARIRAELPVGVEVHAVSDQPKVVGNSIHEFVKSLIEAVVIVLAVSFVSLGFRTGLVVALSIPLVLAMTFLVMYALGLDLQRISLGALIISLGLLVDDAIIAVEMMALKLEQGWDRVRAATYAYTSTAFPMLTGTLITAAGFMPVGLAKSNAGEYTVSIFQVVGISLMMSWIVAVIFTPYLGFKLLPAATSHGDEHAVYQKPFYARFRRLVSWCLEYRKIVILVTVAAFVIAVGLFRFVPKQFFPASNRPEILVDVWLPQASSYAQTEAQVKALEAKLKGDPNILSVTSYVGNGSPRFYLPLEQQLPNLNFAQLMIMSKDEYKREAVLHKLHKLFEEDFPLVRGRVSRLENGPPVGYPIQFRVSGPDHIKIKEVAGKVAALMRANPHIRNVNTDWSERVKVMRLEVDQDKARALGISSQQLSSALQTSLSGVTMTQFREYDRTIDVVARLNEPERTDLNNLKDAKVYLNNGKFIPVSQVAKLKLESEESIVWRRNRMPTISVRADVEGAQAPDVTLAVWPEVQKLADSLPIGYGIEIGGTQESSFKSQASIVAVMPLMLLTVMTLLMFQLQSLSKMVLVLLTAPLGMIGVAATLLIFQVPFGFVAQLGVIALAGMIMRNSVILVDQITQHTLEGEHPWHAIVESAVRRFRPIMLTAAAAILAMVPLTRSTFWGPMAWAIMGGLLVATVLTLLFLPALYAAWYGVRKPLDAGR